MPLRRMTDAQVLDELKSASALNRARRAFSSACGQIEQASQQRASLLPIDLRPMEFEAVEEILAAYKESGRL